MEYNEDNLPIKHQSIWEIVNSYETAQKEIVAAYKILSQAETRLKIFCNYPHVLPDRRSMYGDNHEVKKILKEIKLEAWRGILKKTNAVEFMTPKRYDKFQNDLDKPDNLPEITFETVRDFVENVINAAPDMLIEFIKETFDWLQPGGWALNNYKTNHKSKYELKEKIIKPGIFELRWGGGSSLRYYYQNSISAMDNAFSLLDGKGTAKPRAENSALSNIEAACENKLRECETDYFKFKWYKNGNMHLLFKRMDLVNKMNQIAGENLIKDEI